MNIIQRLWQKEKTVLIRIKESDKRLLEKLCQNKTHAEALHEAVRALWFQKFNQSNKRMRELEIDA